MTIEALTEIAARTTGPDREVLCWAVDRIAHMERTLQNLRHYAECIERTCVAAQDVRNLTQRAEDASKGLGHA